MTFAYCQADSSICTCTRESGLRNTTRGKARRGEARQGSAAQVMPKFSLIKKKEKSNRSATMSTLVEQVLPVDKTILIYVTLHIRLQVFATLEIYLVVLCATLCVCVLHVWSLQNMLNATSICSQLCRVYSIALSEQAACRALHLMDYLRN